MFRRPRLIALLALLFALRAAVPVGYMLSLSEPGAPPGLVFCPAQNPTLELALLGGEDGSHTDHHHGHDAGDELATVEVSGDCGLWAGSLGLSPLAGRLETGFLSASTAPPSAPVFVSPTRCRTAPLGARAPPSIPA